MESLTPFQALQYGLILFAFVFLVLAFLYVMILLFSAFFKATGFGQPKAAKVGGSTNEVSAPGGAEPAIKAAIELPPGAGYGGDLKLKNVDEQTAAIIMAIVSDQSGIPLNELVFKSISLVDENNKREEA